MQPEKAYVSWNDIENFVEDLIKSMEKQNIKPTGVYGIPRGGVILATLVSDKLDIPLLLNASKNFSWPITFWAVAQSNKLIGVEGLVVIINSSQ